ncbi:MAG TPA: YbaY family lipoprotein [Gemmatimonadales bacterium]
MRYPTVAALILSLGACAPAERVEVYQVGGVVTVRSNIALPPAAVMYVTLADITRSDVPPTILTEDTVTVRGAPPIAFELPVARALIDTMRLYAVAARIMDGADVLFASVTSKQVLTQGNASRIELEVEPATLMGPLPRRAADVVAALGRFERIDGSWQEGEAASRISAYFDNGNLRYLEEHMVLGEDEASAANAYYFQQGALFYHESLQLVPAPTPQDPTAQREIAIRMLFGPDGSLVESTKWVDGVPAPLDDAELRLALRHAATLRNAAIRLATQP